MNVEFWNSVFQWGSVALIAVTFVFGAGALWTGNRINTRQTQRLVVLENDLALTKIALAEQQERAANAERALLEVQRRVSNRMLDFRTLVSELKDKPKAGAVEIVYKGDDQEAFSLAGQINRWLGPGQNGDGADWNVSGIRPLNADDVIAPKLNMPDVGRSGAWFGVGIVVAKIPPLEKRLSTDVPVIALMFALQKAGFDASQMTESSKIQPDAVRIVVGQKMN